MSRYPNKNPGIVKADCLFNGSICRSYPPSISYRPMTDTEMFQWDHEVEEWLERVNRAQAEAETRFKVTGSYEIDARIKRP